MYRSCKLAQSASLGGTHADTAAPGTNHAEPSSRGGGLTTRAVAVVSLIMSTEVGCAAEEVCATLQLLA